jgi:hypothetical protein
MIITFAGVITLIASILAYIDVFFLPDKNK